MTAEFDPTDSNNFRAASVFNPNAIVVHYTQSDDISASIVDDWHKARRFIPRGSNPLKYIGYHALIRKSGALELGRSLDVQGCHCRGHNSHTWAICFCGSNEYDWYPTEDQYRIAAAWIKQRMIDKPISNIYRHDELSPTSCPGKLDKSKLLTYIDQLNKGEEKDTVKFYAQKAKTDGEWSIYNVPAFSKDWYLDISNEYGGPVAIKIFANPQPGHPGAGGYKEDLLVKPTTQGGLHGQLKNIIDGLTCDWTEVSIHTKKPLSILVGE